MEKKVLSGAIVSALALSVAMPADAAKKNVKPGLDNPLDDQACSYDEYNLTASWHDPNTAPVEGDTKYGGDIEFDATLFATCDFTGTPAEGTEAAEEASFSYSESAIVDIDLSRDESNPFFYTCEEGEAEGSLDCMASVSWEDVQSAAESAAADKYGYLATTCSATVQECTGETTEVCTASEWVCEDSTYGYLANDCDDNEAIFIGGNPALCESTIVEETFPAELVCLTGPSGIVAGPAPEWKCASTESVCEEFTPQDVPGTFTTLATFDQDSGYFGVKEMNPGRGKGKQNYEKVYATCDDVTP